MALALVMVQGCYKRQYFSYIHNTTGKKVTVNYKYNNESRSITLNPDEVAEIPDIEQWSLTRSPQDDTVFFVYADTTIMHTCEQKIYDDGTGELLFHPAENNILCDDLDNSSWILSDAHHHNDMNKDYYIR